MEKSEGLLVRLKTVEKWLMPLVVLAVSGYGIYAYCYVYCWHTVPHISSAIVLICIFTIFAALIVSCWIIIYLIGPGIVDYNQEVPEIFMCNPYGERQRCSWCDKVKPDRAHHSKELGYCVYRMDHYCLFLGSTIGAKNFKIFIQLVIYFLLQLVYILITQLIYAHQGRVKSHTIALYVIAGVWTLLLTGFLAVHIRYIKGDLTTIEHMDLQRKNYPIYNIDVNGHRVIIRLRKEDLYPYGPYSQGWKLNFIKVFGRSIIGWILPIPVHYSADTFNEHLLDTLRSRFLAGEEGYYMSSVGQGCGQPPSSM